MKIMTLIFSKFSFKCFPQQHIYTRGTYLVPWEQVWHRRKTWS